MTLDESLRRTAPTTYRCVLDPPLTVRGFRWGTAGHRVVDAIASSTGHAYVHPSGVAILFHADGIRFGYPAPWAMPAVDDREAWFDLPYGTSFEVVIDLAAALVDKVDADDASRDDYIEDGLAEMAAQARYEDREPF